MQTASTVILETVFYEGVSGFMVELRLDGRAISTYGPYVNRDDAEL